MFLLCTGIPDAVLPAALLLLPFLLNCSFTRRSSSDLPVRTLWQRERLWRTDSETLNCRRLAVAEDLLLRHGRQCNGSLLDDRSSAPVALVLHHCRHARGCAQWLCSVTAVKRLAGQLQQLQQHMQLGLLGFHPGIQSCRAPYI